MSKSAILFVDDESNILDGFRRMLRSMRSEWSMTFATSGEEALQIMAEKSIDVIVTDMKMPVMNGAQLLVEVIKRHPATVRLVLSGQSEKEMVMKSLGCFHQFIAKPCDSVVLKKIITKILALRELIPNKTFEEMALKAKTLPCLPRTFQKLPEACGKPGISIEDLHTIISKDPALSSKVLQLANSSFFNPAVSIHDLLAAVSILGVATVKDLCLNDEVFRPLREEDLKTFSIHNLLAHSRRVATMTKAILESENADKETLDNAYVVGFLHDIGIWFFIDTIPERYKLFYENDVLSDGNTLFNSEREHLGVDHAAIGGYLLGLWGLPINLVNAVINHHRPANTMEESHSTITSALFVANLCDNAARKSPDAPAFDENELLNFPFPEKFEAWKETCVNVFRKSTTE